MPARLEREPVQVQDALERDSLQRIDDLITKEPRESATLLLGPDEESLSLPKPVFKLIKQLIHDLARGNAVTVVPVHAELTTQQAADFLDISRPFLIKLLEAEKIPYHRIGTHRRIRFEDLVSYQRQRGKERKEALGRMAMISQELGMYE